jgi:putative DNA primase/helicase
MMRADEIHARISWPHVLAQLGIPEKALRNKHGPCPACGGKDRFRFDNKRGQGNYICGQCGAGDGFKLLEHVYGWTFAEARKRVIEAGGLAEVTRSRSPVPALRVQATEAIAEPSARVQRLRRERCAIENCEDAVNYLARRELWPLPAGCTLRAHATAEYWNEGKRIGRYSAIVADVVDLAGELVTAHVTYLQGGKKLAGYEPRKLLSPLTGRVGCAVRLMPATDVLGIAEGIETALSAAVIDGVPVWAALNTSLLAKFDPPVSVDRLVIYADRDEPGLLAAIRLQEHMQDRIKAGLTVEVRAPRAPAKDWNNELVTRNSRSSGEGATHE